MLQLLKEEVDRTMTSSTARLDTTDDNAKWYSTFAMAECAGIVAIIRADGQSISLQLSLILLGLSLLSFILSVFRSMWIRRELAGKSSEIISRLSELEALGANIEHRKKEAHEIIEKWRDQYSGGRLWDTEVFNTLGLSLFGFGTFFACLALLEWI